MISTPMVMLGVFFLFYCVVAFLVYMKIFFIVGMPGGLYSILLNNLFFLLYFIVLFSSIVANNMKYGLSEVDGFFNWMFWFKTIVSQFIKQGNRSQFLVVDLFWKLLISTLRLTRWEELPGVTLQCEELYAIQKASSQSVQTLCLSCLLSQILINDHSFQACFSFMIQNFLFSHSLSIDRLKA